MLNERVTEVRHFAGDLVRNQAYHPRDAHLAEFGRPHGTAAFHGQLTRVEHLAGRFVRKVDDPPTGAHLSARQTGWQEQRE